MDSFLEEPRITPKPTPVIQSIQTPTVPEVSLMFQNARKDKQSPVTFGKQLQSYNAWKLRSNSNNNEFDSFLLTSGNKENAQQNITPDKSFLTKKQVRFESPIHKSVSAPTLPINKNIEHLLPPTNYTPKLNDSPTSPLVFQPTSMETLKRLETLGINNNNESRQYMNSPISVNTNNENRPNTQQFLNSPKTNSPSTFEKMYCSGFPTPNKELDLSFLEPQKNPCSRQEYFKRIDSPSKKFLNYVDHYKNTTPKKLETNYRNTEIIHQPDTNKKICETVETSTTAINNNTSSVNSQEKEKESVTQPENTDSDNNTEKKSSVEGPTVNDLLQIIKLQNEQLQRLQNQVEMLVKISEKNQESTNKNIVTYKDQQVGTSSCEEILEEREETTVQKNVENNNGKKISVGMMTSFEVSFKPPVLAKKKSKSKVRNLTPVADFSNDYSSSNSAAEALAYQKQQQQHQQRYEEEQRSNQGFLKRNSRNKQRDDMNYPNPWPNNTNIRRNNETEYSLGTGHSLEIQEQPESPENSIHIDMQDYDTESEDSDDECSTDTGWTFYKDILGQVNNILENSNRPAYRPNKLPNKRNTANVPQETETTLDQIQQNTLRRLQNDGFLQQSEKCAIRPNEISFAVKQILMKYLPDDGLAEAATRNKTDERCYNTTDKRKPTDISVTAVKYMQQCNVVTNAPQYYGRKQKTTKNKPQPGDPKILDITTLKQQPKLL